MRWLRRMLIFWVIAAPLFYVFGLPALLHILSKEAQKQSLEQCLNQLQREGTTGKASSPLTLAQADEYCHCVSDRLIFTKNDLTDMAQQKPPAALNLMAQSLANSCNAIAKQSIDQPKGVPAADKNGMIPL